MGIGQFSQTGQFGKFSTEELMLLQKLQEGGYGSLLEETYPGVTGLLSGAEATEEKFAGSLDIQSAGIGGTRDRGPQSVEQFVASLGGNRPDPIDAFVPFPKHPSAPGSGFVSRVLGIPETLSSGLTPEGEHFRELDQPEQTKFDFFSQFEDGEIKSRGELIQGEKDLGDGGFMSMMRGETSPRDLLGMTAINLIKALAQTAATTGLNAAVPGLGLAASAAAPETFGPPGGLIGTAVGGVAELIEDLLFGKDEDELKEGEDPGGVDILRKGRDEIAEALQSVKDVTGFSFLDDLITKSIKKGKDAAKEGSLDILDDVKGTVSGLLGLDFTDRETRTAEEETAQLHRIINNVANFGNLLNPREPVSGSPLFQGPRSLEEIDAFPDRLVGEFNQMMDDMMFGLGIGRPDLNSLLGINPGFGVNDPFLGLGSQEAFEKEFGSFMFWPGGGGI